MSGLTAGAALTGAGPALAAPRRSLPSDLFQLGVASGDPYADSVVLWTRLAPDPIDGGGMPDTAVEVEWEIAADESFGRPVQKGVASARPNWGHSVHVEPAGLEPSSEYFYRFRVGTEISPVGRTRTAPAPGSSPETLRFAFASCQNYQHGYYVAHRDLAEQDVEFVAFLGDYIYEGPPNPDAVRQHDGAGEPYSVVDYRNRLALYRTDADLQAAHAACPWIVTFDDHEVDNDWAGPVPQDPDKQSPEAFRKRRIAAFKAWYEHMPVRTSVLPVGDRINVFRSFDWGDLARVHVLDTRQYRTDQAATPDDADDPDATMTGPEQEEWLVEGLTSSEQLWNLVAQQTPMAQTDQRAGPDQVLWTDPWDGYRVQRSRLFEVFGSEQVSNPFVVTGDRHFTMACDLRTDFDDPESTTVAAEIVGTSITSNGDQDQAEWHATWDPIIAESPHWKYGDARRGYLVCDVGREQAVATLRVASEVGSPDGTVSDGAQFVVRSGVPGLEPI